MTRHQTFVNAKRWAEELRFHAGEDIIILLAGNKLDLVHKSQENRQVSREEAEKFAKSNGMLFKETSAYENENIGESFQELLKGIVELFVHVLTLFRCSL